MITQDILLSEQEIKSVQTVFFNHINAIKYRDESTKEKIKTSLSNLNKEINNIEKYFDIKKVSQLVDQFIRERKNDPSCIVDSVNYSLFEFLLKKIYEKDANIADLSHFDPGKPVPS